MNITEYKDKLDNMTANLDNLAYSKKSFKFRDNKELIHQYSLITHSKKDDKEYYQGLFRERITARYYMSRSASASVIYCIIWIHGHKNAGSGSGSAGGYGYHKMSASLQSAISDAGIKLSMHIDGVGSEAEKNALFAIGKALGYKKTEMAIFQAHN